MQAADTWPQEVSPWTRIKAHILNAKIFVRFVGSLSRHSCRSRNPETLLGSRFRGNDGRGKRLASAVRTVHLVSNRTLFLTLAIAARILTVKSFNWSTTFFRGGYSNQKGLTIRISPLQCLQTRFAYAGRRSPTISGENSSFNFVRARFSNCLTRSRLVPK